MKLVKISSGLAVNPENVTSVVICTEGHGHIEITMSTGEKHTLKAEYHESVWDTYNRVLKELEDAR